MCGIFGAIGHDNVIPTTLQAMKMLEYRGYDSIGVATKVGGDIAVYKQAGRVEGLASRLDSVKGSIAIGHTRWATHGVVSDDNAHPFVDFSSNFAIVHNGIIENYDSIRTQLIGQGVTFSSDTDSEVIVHLLSQLYMRSGDILLSIRQCVDSLVGSFALVIMHKDSHKLYLVRQSSPLCVAINNSGSYVCSDTNTISNYSSQVYVLPDKSISVLDESLTVCNYALSNIEVAPTTVVCSYDKSISSDYMLDEIMSQPMCLARALDNYTKPSIPLQFLKKIKRIYYIGCGTAYHAGVVVASQLRKLCNIDIHCVVASEFAYGSYPCDNHTLAIFISQSGETADTISACNRAVGSGAYCHGVVNVSNSTLSTIVSSTSYIHAGAEIAVASTKAYTNSVLVLLLLALDILHSRGDMSLDTYNHYTHQLHLLPTACDSMLASHTIPQLLGDSIPSAVFFVGRDIDYATAMESSLKLKEISYIHSEAYPAGELKHGTLALVEEGVTVVAICTNNSMLGKCHNAICEVASRGARVVLVSQYSLPNCQVVTLPVVGDIAYSILSVIPMQLFAYYYAKKLHRDVDKPKNLAKSVTVE